MPQVLHHDRMQAEHLQSISSLLPPHVTSAARNVSLKMMACNCSESEFARMLERTMLTHRCGLVASPSLSLDHSAKLQQFEYGELYASLFSHVLLWGLLLTVGVHIMN